MYLNKTGALASSNLWQKQKKKQKRFLVGIIKGGPSGHGWMGLPFADTLHFTFVSRYNKGSHANIANKG